MSLCQQCSRTYQCQWPEIQSILKATNAVAETPSGETEDSYKINSDEDKDCASSADLVGPSKKLKLSSSPTNADSSPPAPSPTTNTSLLDTTQEGVATAGAVGELNVNSDCCPSVSCVVCLGVLENQYVCHLAEVISKHYQHVSPTGVNLFSLAIHIPLAVSVRRMGMENLSKKLLFEKAASEPLAVDNNYIKDELRYQLRKELGKSLNPLAYNWDSPFCISLSLEHATGLDTCTDVRKLRPKLFPRHKGRWGKKCGGPVQVSSIPLQNALKELKGEDFESRSYFLSPISSSCEHRIEFLHRSCFVAGRYNKFSRELPQTPWVVDGVKKAETSVEELICPKILAAFRASSARFSSSGREDVDVKMLGQGRPFLLELVNPMDVSISQCKLERIEEEINAATTQVAVRNLTQVSRESSALLKEGEEDKRKVYSAVVWTKEEVGVDRLQEVLDQEKDLVIRQKTPIRVLHRRTLAVRERTIYCMKTEKVDGHRFLLKLETQAGTYIKEFVHGDFGRTQPNVESLLGVEADILSLDVLDVHLHWPP